MDDNDNRLKRKLEFSLALGTLDAMLIFILKFIYLYICECTRPISQPHRDGRCRKVGRDDGAAQATAPGLHTLSARAPSRAFYNIASIASIRALVCYLLKMHNTNHSQFDVLDAYSRLLQILVNSVLCNFVKVEISM